MTTPPAPLGNAHSHELRLARAALTQEINTLLRHLDPRRNPRGRSRQPQLITRLRNLRRLRRRLLRQPAVIAG